MEAVAAKLKERNPGFDGKVKHTIEDGVVTGLEFLTDKVTDISPVRALTGLQTLQVRRQQREGTACRPVAAEGHETDDLNCGDTKVSDLSPLKDMKLTNLDCGTTQVSDLSPLKDMKLTELDCMEHAGVRPVAAEGHEADVPGLQLHAGVRPVAAEGHEADGPELR